ncbi:MAG: ABC transporter ATP-binding protein [Bacteroidia bacterium]|nr:MAG: ABC transporter ATP-binding protein [Bacteroidia bacterium]
MAAVVEVHGLLKTYRSGVRGRPVEALKNISFSVDEGEIVAILGLNGAGKSTLAKILLDLVRPSGGEAMLFGSSVHRQDWKGRVGYLPELFSAPPSATPRRLLRYLGEIHGMSGSSLNRAIDSQLESLGLTEVADRRISTLSKGTVQRVGLAQALLHTPKLLLLDEPTEGLDPAGQRMIRRLLMALSASGVTILLNSHLLSEVELLAKRVAILHRGMLAALGTQAELLPRNQRFSIEISQTPPESGWQEIGSTGIWKKEVSGTDTLQRLLTNLESSGITPSTVKPLHSSLEDVFVEHISQLEHRQ